MSDLVALLQDFYRDKLTVYLRHQAGARLVVQYDANNTYQYIVNRDDVQLTWIAKAIEELGAAVPEVSPQSRDTAGKKSDAAQAVIREDAADSQAFVDRWRPRIEQMIYPQLAMLVARLFRGDRPQDIPVQQPTTFELVINLTTARSVWLTIPEGLIFRSDKVID